MNKKKALTKRKRAMYEAMKAQLGVITSAALQAGISRETHYLWLEKDPNYKQWINEMPDITHDFVENALLKEIKKGNSQCITFYLKTKGKTRGYVEERKIEITGNVSNLSPEKLQSEINRLLK